MSTFHPWQFVLVTVAGWINRHQQDVIDYLIEENRVLLSATNPLATPWRLRDDGAQRRGETVVLNEPGIASLRWELFAERALCTESPHSTWTLSAAQCREHFHEAHCRSNPGFFVVPVDYRE